MEGREDKGKKRIKKEGERGRGVQLSFDLPEAREVYVVGDFNSWDTQSLPMKKTKEGVWKTKLTLPSGRYEYKLFADGSWVEDIPTTERVSNPFGTQNCVIWVEQTPLWSMPDKTVTNERGLITIELRVILRQEERQGYIYPLNDRSYGAFSRSVRLPAEVESGKIGASYKNGILKITLPKSEKVKAKEVKIKIE